jgi:hypothetical protein
MIDIESEKSRVMIMIGAIWRFDQLKFLFSIIWKIAMKKIHNQLII